MSKKRDACAKLLFCKSKPIRFLPFSLPSPSSLLKLPIVFFEREPTEALVDLITLRCQGFLRAAFFHLNPIEYCVFRFSKERSGAYFCPT